MKDTTIKENIKKILLNKDKITDIEIHNLRLIIDSEVSHVINLKRDINFRFINDSITDLLTYFILESKIDLNHTSLYGFCLNINNNLSIDKLDIDFTISNNFELFINNEPYSSDILNNLLINYLATIDKIHVSNINVSNIINLFYYPNQHSNIPFYAILKNKELLKDFVYAFLTYKEAENINGIEQKFYKIDPNKKINNIQKEDINIYDYYSNSIESTFNHVFLTQLQILIPEFQYDIDYYKGYQVYYLKSHIPNNIRKKLSITIHALYEHNNQIPYIKISTNGGYNKEMSLNEDPFDFIDNCLFAIKNIYTSWYQIYTNQHYLSELKHLINNKLKEKGFDLKKRKALSFNFYYNKDWFGDIFVDISYHNVIIENKVNFEKFYLNLDNHQELENLNVKINEIYLKNIIVDPKFIIKNHKTRL